MPKNEWLGERFVIRRERLDGARRRLRIAEPVEIRFTRYPNKGYGGRLIGFREASWRIGLDRSLPADEASQTLWHELVHVAQARRIGGYAAWYRRVRKEHGEARLDGAHPRRLFKGRAYDRMPLEMEAEQRGQRWHQKFPLAEPL